MSEWTRSSLGQIAELRFGKTPPRSEARFWNPSKGYPWATIADMRTDPVLETAETVSEAGLLHAGRSVPAGSVMMSFKLTVGRVARAGTELLTNEAIVSVHGKQGQADDGWLYHALPKIARSGITDTAVKGSTLNKVKLERLRVHLPPLEEQRRIAEALDTIDETIHATERVIAKLWQARIGAVEYKLNMIDNEYCHRSLLDVVSIPSGQVDPRVEPWSSLILIAPDHIEGDGRGRLLARVSARDQGAISGKYRFEAGDVIYSKIRPELRKAWLTTFSGLCSADMYPLSPSPTVIGEYVVQVILGQRFSRFAVSVSARSSGMPKVNRRELAEFGIALAPFEVQQTVARIAESYSRRIDSEGETLRKIKQVRSGLADDLLSGRIRTAAT